MKFLEGKKTYLGAIALALLGVFGFWFGVVDLVTAGSLLASALVVFGMRDAMGRLIAQGIMTAVDKARQQHEALQPGELLEMAAPPVLDFKSVAQEIARELVAQQQEKTS